VGIVRQTTVRYAATGSTGWVSPCSERARAFAAQAADTTLTLACQGTTISGLENAKPEPVSMGLSVNFTSRTVQGFGAPGVMDYPVKITA
jgi:hypothetical protein